MHMADALMSPATGAAMFTATAGITVWAVKKIAENPEPEEKTVPLMGVMGAFVFAAQMINFSIPGTGSSGHLGGGLLLAILLGPAAGFLTMAAVLLIQALFFGDGGLLAFGANVFNMGFLTCCVAYPLIYKPIAKRGSVFAANGGILLAALAGLQLGAFAVVIQTVLSGRTELPFGTFILFMQPIHLAIGLVEGFVTIAVVSFVRQARPEMIFGCNGRLDSTRTSKKGVLVGLGVAAAAMAGGISLLASASPDGLEWSIAKTAGQDLEAGGSGIHQFLAGIQERLSIFPDYQVPGAGSEALSTGLAGIIGTTVVLALAAGIAFAIRKALRGQKGVR